MVAEGPGDVGQDLFEQAVKVEDRADPLGHALQQEQLFDPLLGTLAHRTVPQVRRPGQGVRISRLLAESALRRTAPGENPMKRLNARLKAASDW